MTNPAVNAIQQAYDGSTQGKWSGGLVDRPEAAQEVALIYISGKVLSIGEFHHKDTHEKDALFAINVHNHWQEVANYIAELETKLAAVSRSDS